MAGSHELPMYYLEDTGCNLHPACLTCPFPVCKHDLPPGMTFGQLEREEWRRERDRAMAREYAAGVSRRQIGRRYGVSGTTVRRVLGLR